MAGTTGPGNACCSTSPTPARHPLRPAPVPKFKNYGRRTNHGNHGNPKKTRKYIFSTFSDLLGFRVRYLSGWIRTEILHRIILEKCRFDDFFVRGKNNQVSLVVLQSCLWLGLGEGLALGQAWAQTRLRWPGQLKLDRQFIGQVAQSTNDQST